MKVYLIAFFLLLSLDVFSQSTTWKVLAEESTISYSAKHVLHAWKGINNKVLGLAVINATEKQLDKMAILVNVRNFDSNNSSRDAHALEVLDALQYPQVKFYSEEVNLTENSYSLKGTLDFHGVKAPLEVAGPAQWTAGKLKLSGNFDLQPTAFKIELPSFMMIPMEDELKFTFELTFKAEKE
ncbi:MAG: YceI family protein [Flavobacteriaceae bacterium]|jgi:polyisoprenoid-binding protein YceI